MENKIKNVIFLVVDSLRYDRLGSSGYPIDQTPSIDFLVRNGVSCVNTFTHACGTQFSSPSVFTSTLPLDKGGYDRGIKDREKSFVEILREGGLNTVGFATGHWLGKFFYYDKGFNEFHQVFGISGFWKNMRDVFIAHYLNLKDKGTISSEECLRRIKILLEEAIRHALTYHEENIVQPAALGLRKDRDIHSYDHAAVTGLLKKELDLLKKEDYGFDGIDNFYRKLIALGCVYKGWFKFGEEPGAHRDTIRDLVIRKLETHKILKKNIYKSPNARYLKDAIINWMDKNKEEPFFLWAHFMDIHSKNYTTSALQGIPALNNFSDRLKAGKNYYGDEIYDASCKYVDKQIGCIIKYLKDKKLIDETLIVITSDHGREAGAPYRERHGIAYFYEEFIKIPLIFYNPSLGRRVITGLCGAIDIAPTILDILGIKPHASFKGISVFSPELDKRPYLIMEHTHKGACDIGNKPVYLSVRTKKYKYIWREYIAGKDVYAKSLVELYDLENDPSESFNLADKEELKNIKEEMDKITAERFREVSLVRKAGAK